jgi:hypothetical protein
MPVTPTGKGTNQYLELEGSSYDHRVYGILQAGVLGSLGRLGEWAGNFKS